jgi:hypothetical protein
MKALIEGIVLMVLVAYGATIAWAWWEYAAANYRTEFLRMYTVLGIALFFGRHAGVWLLEVRIKKRVYELTFCRLVGAKSTTWLLKRWKGEKPI